VAARAGPRARAEPLAKPAWAGSVESRAEASRAVAVPGQLRAAPELRAELELRVPELRAVPELLVRLAALVLQAQPEPRAQPVPRAASELLAEPELRAQPELRAAPEPRVRLEPRARPVRVATRERESMAGRMPTMAAATRTAGPTPRFASRQPTARPASSASPAHARHARTARAAARVRCASTVAVSPASAG
jgi:ribonuclease E